MNFQSGKIRRQSVAQARGEEVDFRAALEQGQNDFLHMHGAALRAKDRHGGISGDVGDFHDTASANRFIGASAPGL